MKLLLLIIVCNAALAAKVFVNNWENEWNSWKLKHDKVYASHEEIKRQMIWESNFRHVLLHNYEFDLGKQTYRLGMNRFADMTTEEFRAFYLGIQGDFSDDICLKNVSFNVTTRLPGNVDWRKHGCVTPVKNQKECGSCWAFSATGSLEGQHFKKTGKLVSLSEQNLVDCSAAEGDEGCMGGFITDAFKYVLDSGGLDTEESYPYHAKKENCKFKKQNIGATLTGCVDLPSGDENALKVALAKVGPISIAIDAGHKSFQLYKEGIYYERNCDSTMLDHGVLAVGYGSQDGNDYWIVKNSWSEAWGNEGYIRMARNRNNNCGVSSMASYPLV